ISGVLQKCCLDIHLIDGHVFTGGIGDEDANSLDSSNQPASNDKEMELWVELKRMYEPDLKDQLWTLTQNYMHAPIKWKLYDLSGVHHVTAKDKEIFMLVEKDYPLKRGVYNRDLVQGAVTIKRVYYVKGLNHNLFSVGQFYDADLEVAFRKSTCFICDLKGNDLLIGSRGTDLYLITLQDSNYPNLICLMAKATSSQARLWHRHLSHLNFDTINLLSKNDIVVGLPKLVQRRLQAQVRVVRTDKGMKILNQTLHAYFAAEGIQHQTSIARTPEQNGVIERQNCTLVEASRTMLSTAKVPLFFWAEATATACFTQNRSLVIPRHEKIPYHIINDRKPLVKFLRIFGSVCYIVRDGENLDKMKEKGDECIFVGYSTQSRAFRVFNKRTRVIMESIHVNFDELPHMASVQISYDPAPECQTMALEHDSLSLGRKCQENVSHRDKIETTSNKLDLLFSLMFDELLNGSPKVVSKSFVVSAADAPNERQQLTTPLNNYTTPAPTCINID
nr:hypothetical protein [Tanacetum cinerariifolium]